MKTNIPTRQHPLGAGRRIPYDALCEYVESTGAQYVLLGPVKTGRFSVDLSATVTSGAARYDMFFGTASIAGGGLTDRLICYNDAQAYARYSLFRGNAYARENIAYPTLTKTRQPFGLSQTMDLFLFHSPSFAAYDARCRLRSFALWDALDNLALDLAPCRVGSAGALYDRVSGTLYYSATSTALIPGPDLP